MAVTTEQPIVDATKAQQHQAVEVLVEDNKVFVGNLPFKTTQEALTKFFESAGKVTEATVIKHGRRSLGYGFVAFETAAEAEKARNELNKKELEGREVNVEVAKPKVHIDKKPETSSSSEAGSSTRAARKPRGRANRRRAKKDAVAAAAATSQDDQPKEEAPKQDDKSSAKQSSEEDAPASGRKSRRVRRRRSPKAQPSEPSKTTVFVANLPYATSDETLAEIFKEFKVKTAQVARMKNNRSKGYGFVDFESEEEQKRALDTVKDVMLEGREIYLKVAMSERSTPAGPVNSSTEAVSAAVIAAAAAPAAIAGVEKALVKEVVPEKKEVSPKPAAAEKPAAAAAATAEKKPAAAAAAAAAAEKKPAAPAAAAEKKPAAPAAAAPAEKKPAAPTADEKKPAAPTADEKKPAAPAAAAPAEKKPVAPATSDKPAAAEKPTAATEKK